MFVHTLPDWEDYLRGLLDSFDQKGSDEVGGAEHHGASKGDRETENS